jgi:release factor glutamine methyltransferase
VTTKGAGSTLRDLLAYGASELRAAGLDSPRLDATVLLSAALGWPREQILAHPEQVANPKVAAAYRRFILRRAGREPVAYITCRKEFMSLELEVTRDVLVPRPDSEILAEQALAFLDARRADGSTPRSPVVVDVGTGSGALALAIAHGSPGAEVWALDISPAAVALARRNASRLGLAGRVRAMVSDLLSGLAGSGFAGADLIVANLPYVSSNVIESLAPEVALHEPRLALDGGPDGLDLIRRLVPQAVAALRRGGALGLECDPAQCKLVAEMLCGAGFARAEIARDLGGLDRTVWGFDHGQVA